MQGSHPLKKLVEDFKESDLEKIQALMERMEIIHRDLGDFIGLLDRLYMEKTTAGKPPGQDFLTSRKGSRLT